MVSRVVLRRVRGAIIGLMQNVKAPWAKRWLAGAGIALLALLSLPSAASAHVLRADGTISALLHTDPDDDPVIGVPTGYAITFADSTGRFSLPACDCTLAIVKHGETIATQPLAAAAAHTSEGGYTFMVPDVYTFRVTGTPKLPGAFQPFALGYTMRVGDNPATEQVPAWVWAAIGVGIVAVLGVAYAMSRQVG